LGSEESEDTTDDGSQIDVLVVYTPAAQAEAGGPAAMTALINLAVAESNLAYANSGVSQRLRLVHAAEVAYAENGSFSTHLARLQSPGDGYLDGVPALRDAYSADLVSLLVAQNQNLCGIAYLMGPGAVGPGFADWAFSVVAHDCAIGYYSFGHELGHNMGSQHDRGNAGSPGAFGYSYGYQDPQADFRTIMAYNCPGGCPRIQFFSNPAVAYQGQTTGVDSAAPDSADNHLSLNNTALIVANFRASVDAGTPAPTATPTNTRTATPARSPTPTQTPTLSAATASPGSTLSVPPTSTPEGGEANLLFLPLVQ
jgi:hypothetical protein